MKVYTSESASTVICPNVARSCAGERCAAWSELGDKGFCGVVAHISPITAPVAPITHYSTIVPASEVAAFADVGTGDINSQSHHQPRNPGRPKKF